MILVTRSMRVYSRPISWPTTRAELPDKPLDESPSPPLRPIDVTTAKPVDSADDGQAETYRVLSAHGFTLGKFTELPAAISALSTWAQAVAIASGTAVIQRKR